MADAERDQPLHYSYAVGSIGVTVVSDGQVTSPLSPTFVGNASIEDVQAALTAADLPTETLTTSFAPVLIETAGQLVLVDTGLGADGRAAGAGRTIESLATAGVAPGDVDLVIVSHFHRDHVNGMLAASDLAFPKAQVLVPGVEQRFWLNDAKQAGAAPGRMQDLFANNRRILSALGDRVHGYEWETEVVPGLHAMGAPGHSIGHTCFMLQSGDKRVFLQSDLTNHAAIFLPHPDWWASFDQDPELSVKTRRRLYDWLVAEAIAVQAFHHPFPGLSRLVADGRGYRRVPIAGV